MIHVITTHQDALDVAYPSRMQHESVEIFLHLAFVAL